MRGRTIALIKNICALLLSIVFACVIIVILSAKSIQADPIPAEKGQILTTSTENVSSVQNYVLGQAEALGVSSEEVSFIVSHESGWDPTRTGDDANSRGVFQISRIWHPEVSDQCAFNLVCSTSWSLRWILSGHVNQWSTWRLRCKLYPYDHPPGC
jgi:hypothetical protein